MEVIMNFIYDSKDGTWKCEDCHSEKCSCKKEIKRDISHYEIPFVTPTLIEHKF